MTNPQTAPAAATTLQPGEVSLLDQIIEDGRVGGRDASAKERGKDMVKQSVTEVLAGSITMSRDTEAMINARIA
ncbi:MAG TPA: type VI secretion system contractile sheath large subunit, partial [Gemmatimonadaceae bacterium]|nr:type VI secretion system contractile sheath large subunit [Gemmatimonadaceae bacterium]